ncbi:MAG: adenylate kinase [Bacteroidetes bacterium]|jgi:adenylate kinase|nr:adenylate kinase [Bacteroidota bacterium]
MLNIIICGAPGCGKGTQSELIVEKYKLNHLSTGDLLRKEIESKTELGKEAESYISKGNLVPDQMIISILTKAIDAQDKEKNGVILDGFPRTVAQAEALEQMLQERGMSTSVLLDLQVDRRELINRLLKRGETSGRSDDNMETIKKRLEVYEAKTAPVSDFYKSLGKYASVDGMGTIDEIFGRIASVLDSNK